MNNTIYLLIPILLPLAGALGNSLLPTRFARRRFLLAVMALEVVFACLTCFIYGGFTLVDFGSFSIAFSADGVSKLFAILFACMFLACGAFGFEYFNGHRERSYYVFYLLAMFALMGLCFAGNLFTFYMFYEFMTMLTFPLVLHERTPQSIRAAFKYLGYSLLGAALALFGFFILTQYSSSVTFRAGGVLNVYAKGHEGILLLAAFAMLLGFGGKAGLMPLHDWLPTAHPQAPAPASAILSGIITKSGLLGIIRTLYYLFGARFLLGTWVQQALLGLSLLTVFVGSMLAYKEDLLKKRLAYSTVSQVSYALFGLFLLNGTAFTGALLQVVFHAVCKVCLFLCAGAIIHMTGRTHVSQLRGIGLEMPVTIFCFAVGGLSLVGIPPFAGFVSKWYLAQGSLSQYPVWGWVGPAVLLISALLTAGYLLVPVARGFFPGSDFEPDIRVRIGSCMSVPLICLATALRLLGLFPQPLIMFIRSIAITLL